MSRVRNGVIILILCLIGAATYQAAKPKQNSLGLPQTNDQLKDAVAAKPSHHAKPKLSLGAAPDEQLKDAVAESPAIPTGNSFDHGNAPANIPGPAAPRGNSFGGFSGIGNSGPGQDLHPAPRPNIVSPSAPSNPL